MSLPILEPNEESGYRTPYQYRENRLHVGSLLLRGENARFYGWVNVGNRDVLPSIPVPFRYALAMRSRRLAYFCVTLLLFIVSTALSVWPNDTLATLGAGGLIPLKSAQIAIESEDLEVSTHEIKIRYQFHNSSDNDVDALVGFPLPELDGSAVYNTPMEIPKDGEFNFVDFKVISAGIVVPVKMEARAFYGGRDITERLESLGIPATVLPEPLNLALLKLAPAQRQQLEKDEWIVAGDFNPPLPGVGNKGWWATWTMRVQFYWTQLFPSHKSIELVQTYRPIVGGTILGLDDDVQNNIQAFCADEQTLHQVAAIREQESHSKKAFHEGYLKGTSPQVHPYDGQQLERANPRIRALGIDR